MTIGPAATASLLMLLGATPFGIASQSESAGWSPEGLTQSQVTTALGPPSATDASAGGGSDSDVTWTYETPSETVQIAFRGGRATIIIPSSAPAPEVVSDPETAYQRAIVLQIKAEYADCVRWLEACLMANPRHRRCKNLLADTLPKYEGWLNSQYLIEKRPDQRRNLVEQLLHMHPDSASLKASFDAETGAITERQRRALIRLMDVRADIEFAISAHSVAEFEDADRRLNQYGSFPRAVRSRAELRKNALVHLEQEVDAADSIRSLRTAADDESRLHSLIGDSGEGFSTKIKLSAIKVAVNTKRRPSDGIESRVLEEMLRSNFNAEIASDPHPWPWQEIGAPAAAIEVQRVVKITSPCVESGLSVIPPIPINNARIVETAQADIALQFDIDCSVGTVNDSPQPVNSTYVASYQQIVNPDYVRAQSDLQMAQASLAQVRADNAANPPVNAWVAAAQGLAEGLARSNVDKALAKLQQTPPYLSQPVMLQYVAQKYTTIRTARVMITLTVRERVGSWVDSHYHSAETRSTDYGVMNVLPSDSQGLRERIPSLRSSASLLDDAYMTLMRETEGDLYESLAALFAERARQARNDVVRLAGNLLYVRDCSPSTFARLNADSFVDEVRHTQLGDIRRLGLDVTRISFPSATTTFSTSATGDASGFLHSPVQRALPAVVTVVTDDGLGSGFFIGSNGLVVTNAHVLAGKARATVYTTDGSKYFATVVRVSAKPDLALLKTAALVQHPLRLVDSSPIEVGSDVFAVGSARGLEGTVTKGIISASRTIEGIAYFQIDAAINPGNSGGPLLTPDGNVIGVNTFKVSPDSSEALGFAITSNEVRKAFGEFLK
jgi:S1-C subfamily serine protease